MYRYLICVLITGLLGLGLSANVYGLDRSYDESIINDTNLLRSILIHQNRSLQNIDIYANRNGVFIAISAIPQHLGYDLQIDTTSGMITGKNYLGQSFILDKESNSYFINGVEKKFQANLLVISNQEFFMDLDLFNRIFPITATFNYQELTIDIKPDSDLPEQSQKKLRHFMQGYLTPLKQVIPINELKLKQQYAESDETKILQKAIINQQQKQEENDNLPSAPIKLPSPLIGTTEPTEQSIEPSEAIPNMDDFLLMIHDDNLFIMEVVLNNKYLPDTIDIYPQASGYYTPLSLFIELMDFPIEIDFDTQIAEGWFISQDNNFKLDINKQNILIGDNSTSYNPSNVIFHEKEIYINSQLIKEWFGFDSKVNKSTMVIELSTSKQLPFEGRHQRNERWKNLQNQKQATLSNKYKIVETGYQQYGMPYIDVDFSNNYDSSLGDSQTNYSIRATNQFLYHTTYLYATGSDEDPLSGLTLRAEKYDENKGLFGPLRASQFTIGDIDSIALPMVDSSSQGRGITLSNHAINKPDQFDVTSFIGDSKPGWEVELYRNQELIGFQTIGSDGRYRFIDIPVLYNNNLFRLVFYGPQGQIEEKTEQFLIDNSLLPTGKIDYEFSIDEKSQELFNVGDDAIPHAKDIRAIGQINFGLTDNITLNSGIASLPVDQDGSNHYVLAGTKISFGNMFINLDSSYNVSDPGWISRMSILTAYDGWNIRMEQKLLDGFTSPSETSNNKSETALNLNKTISIGKINNLSVGIDLTNDIDDEGEKRQTASARLGKSYKGFNFTNNLNYQKISQSDDQITGIFATSSRLFNTNIRGTINYSLTNTSEIERINATIQRTLNEGLNMRLNISKETAANTPAKLTSSLDWLFHNYKISPELSLEEEGNFSIGFNINVSLGKDPRNNDILIQPTSMTSGGIIWAEAYMDDNGNLTKDEEEEIIDNAKFLINKRPLGKNHNMATNIATNTANIITLDSASLDDIFLQPALEGYMVKLVPASVTKLSFPVQETTEIDGTAYLKRKSGHIIPLAYANLELVDQKGQVVKTASSAFDGFYVFNQVIPGDYTIRIQQAELERLSIKEEAPVIISVKPGAEEFYNGYDIYSIENDV